MNSIIEVDIYNTTQSYWYWHCSSSSSCKEHELFSRLAKGTIEGNEKQCILDYSMQILWVQMSLNANWHSYAFALMILINDLKDAYVLTRLFSWNWKSSYHENNMLWYSNLFLMEFLSEKYNFTRSMDI